MSDSALRNDSSAVPGIQSPRNPDACMDAAKVEIDTRPQNVRCGEVDNSDDKSPSLAGRTVTHLGSVTIEGSSHFFGTVAEVNSVEDVQDLLSGCADHISRWKVPARLRIHIERLKS